MISLYYYEFLRWRTFHFVEANNWFWQTNKKATTLLKISPKAALDKSTLFSLQSYWSLFISLAKNFSLSLLLWVVRSKDTLHTFIHKSQLDERLQNISSARSFFASKGFSSFFSRLLSQIFVWNCIPVLKLLIGDNNRLKRCARTPLRLIFPFFIDFPGFYIH